MFVATFTKYERNVLSSALQLCQAMSYLPPWGAGNLSRRRNGKGWIEEFTEANAKHREVFEMKRGALQDQLGKLETAPAAVGAETACPSRRRNWSDYPRDLPRRRPSRDQRTADAMLADRDHDNFSCPFPPRYSYRETWKQATP